jgi:ribosomal protein L11 methyltransferase
VLAVDIDRDAVRVARKNVDHNGLDRVVSVQEGDLLKHVKEQCDICVANIISDVIIANCASLMQHIVPGGLFICSGIVVDRTDEVRSALETAGYQVLEERHRGEWTAFLSRRN